MGAETTQNTMRKLCSKIRRRLVDHLSVPFYHPAFLRFMSGFFRERALESTPSSKVAAVTDLFDPRVIRMYENLLAWQARETAEISISHDCCDPQVYDALRTAYESRISHRGKPGRSRRMRFEMIWETVWPLVNLKLEPGLRVADIGAENSCLPPYFASLGCEAFGIDAFIGGYGTFFREQVLGLCKNETLILDVSSDSGRKGQVRYRREDATHINFPDNYFDRITCISTIEHIHDDTAVAKELARILRPGGILAMTTTYGYKYSQDNTLTDDDAANYVDANRIYTKEALFKRIVDPAGLRFIGNHRLDLDPRSWHRRHFPGQSPDFVSVAFFLTK